MRQVGAREYPKVVDFTVGRPNEMGPICTDQVGSRQAGQSVQSLAPRLFSILMPGR